MGTPVALVFSSPQKSAFLNSSCIQNTMDKKALCSDNNDNNGNNNNNILTIIAIIIICPWKSSRVQESQILCDF